MDPDPAPPVVCANCGHSNEAAARFCSMCGRALAVETTQVRKLVTVLFADLEESTALGESLDPEVLRDLLQQFFGAMSAVIEAWGGTVSKYIGDAVVAVFGYPTAREDDPVRALHAGLAMQDRLADLNETVSERYERSLAMRVAVNTGEIAVSDNPESLLVGDVFNTASRLEGLAPAGAVIAADRTRRAAADHFGFEDLGQHAVKGKAIEVKAWRVEHVLAGAPKADQPLFLGRQAELAILQTVAWQVREEERPGLVLVIGEPGIGKSRLAQEFRQRAAADFDTLAGRCLPYGEGITYWPLREVLWEAASISLEDSAPEAVAKLEATVGSFPAEMGVDTAWLMSALAATAGMKMEHSQFDDLSPESAREELLLAWPAFVTGLAARHPTLVLIEDLHWAEEPLLDMLEEIVLRSLGRFLLVATARKEFIKERPGWASRAIPSQISLGPLGRASLDELVGAVVPGIADEDRGRIAHVSNGNPFFAVEILRQMHEQGTGALDVLPDTVRGMLTARIDSLPASHRQVLQAAAVVGDIFWPESLSLDDRDDVADTLRILEERGFVTTRTTSSIPHQRELAFRHDLLREAAYQSIPHKELPRLHRATAEWTEAIAGDGRRDEFVELIAHHYETAARLTTAAPESGGGDLQSKAIASLLDAGEAARARFSIDQAISYARRARSLADDDAERLLTLELEANAYHAAAHAEEAWPIYQEAASLARQIDDEEAVSRIVTGATLLISRYGGTFVSDDWKPDAIAMIERRIAEIGPEGDSYEHAALLIGRSVWNRREVGHAAAADIRRDTERALEVAEKVGSTPLISHALDSYLMELRTEGFCDITEIADRISAIGESFADRRQIHEMLVTAAISYGEVGEFAKAEQLGRIAHDDARRMGLHQQIHGLRTLVAGMAPRGEFEALETALADITGMVARDGGRMCEFGGGAVAVAVLTAFERGGLAAGEQLLAFFDGALPDRPLHRPQHQLVDYVRPFLPVDQVRDRHAGVPRASPAHEIYRLRTEIPLSATTRQLDHLAQLRDRSRTLAADMCAPVLDALADWADLVLEAPDAPSPGQVHAAIAECAGPYLARRLLVDLVSIGREVEPELISTARDHLEVMGASSTLAHLETAVAAAPE